MNRSLIRSKLLLLQEICKNDPQFYSSTCSACTAVFDVLQAYKQHFTASVKSSQVAFKRDDDDDDNNNGDVSKPQFFLYLYLLSTTAEVSNLCNLLQRSNIFKCKMLQVLSPFVPIRQRNKCQRKRTSYTADSKALLRRVENACNCTVADCNKTKKRTFLR